MKEIYLWKQSNAQHKTSDIKFSFRLSICSLQTFSAPYGSITAEMCCFWSFLIADKLNGPSARFIHINPVLEKTLHFD
jgi:hypothetical protein